MKFDLKIPLCNYDGKLFTRPVLDDEGKPVMEGGKVKQEPLTLQNVLESACLNADQQDHGTGEKKMIVFSLLSKIHAADPVADLKAEDLVLLKTLVGKQLTVAAVGAVYQALDKPVIEVDKIDK